MKRARGWTALALIALGTYCMTMGTYAGTWKQDSVGWWFDNGDGTWPAGTWKWIDGNVDGIAECYYFTSHGYMVYSTTTKDGYEVNRHGAWVIDGAVQKKSVRTVSNPVVKMEHGDLDLMAAIIECEAIGEPYECKVAVGAVVINRVKSSAFPNTISGVLYQRKQFTPATSGKLARVLERGAKEVCYKAAIEALQGNDITNGCLFFRVNDGREGLVLGKTVFYYKPKTSN